MAHAICCGTCSWPIPPEAWNRDDVFRCPGCRLRVEVVAFPAIERTRTGPLPEALAADTEASCFYHPESRARVPCDQCGRFLCGLCELEIDGRHLCPVCFQTGVASNQLEVAETSRTMWDSIALATATFPVLLFWPAFIGAPAALFLVIRRWNAPSSILPRTRIRFYLAALFALAEISGIVFLIWAILRLPGRINPR
jgi:hypothetical protein